jgi:predicted phage terminase large subunit-like protein
MDASTLRNLRQSYIDQGLPDVYNREYLNHPIDETFAYFKREDLLPMVEEDFDKDKQYYAAIDFAVSTADRSDYTVITVGGVDDRGILHIVDVRRGRWDSLETVEEMFTVQQRYSPEIFITERGAIEKAIGPFLKQEMLRRKVYMNLDASTPTKDKMSRARGIQARLRAGSVRFDRDAEWFLAFEEEMTRFPKDKHDDQVDSISWLGLKLDAMTEPQTPEEEEEEEINEYKKETLSGRSRCTGY